MCGGRCHNGGMEMYRTIAGPASSELEIKRSRFLGELTPVRSEEAARDVISAARAAYWDARHHCSAFVLGPDQEIQRSSDDGEPAGTAGAPMLEVLRGAGVSDVVAVVTRWFGGTLLGAGGLVRAYSEAVRGALEAAEIIERHLLPEVEVTLGHDVAGRFEADVRAQGMAVLDAHYAQAVTFRLGTYEPDLIAPRVAELTGGRAEAKIVGTSWVDVAS